MEFVAAGITPRRADTAALERVATGTAPQQKPQDAAGHGDVDPHVWFDPQHTIHIVQHIRDALVHSDATHAASYEGQYPALHRQAASAGYVDQRASHHNSAATALASVSTEVADPSLRQIAALVGTIQQTRVPAIFAETMVNPRLMQRIAQEARVNLTQPLYTDALGAPGSPGATYLHMMQYNVNTIVNALQP